MIRYSLILFFSILINNANADNKQNIINNLQNTKNLEFKFEQNINGKIQNGNCVIKYPKKIFCNYKKNNKVLVSNGKSLVIKTKSSYYRYPLKRTPLNLILDKNFLINKIYDLNEKIIDNSLINFTITENDNKIDVFFDNQTFNLVGWQTSDIYQNSAFTLLYSIKINQDISKNLFKLPAQN